MSDQHEPLIRVGITHGDPNGIGYEVIIKTFMDHAMLELCTPIIYGLSKTASFYRKSLGAGEFNFYGISGAEKAAKHQCNLVNISDEEFIPEPGILKHDAGKFAVKALERAVGDLRAGLIDVLVTAPFHKKAIQSDSFKFQGHTEFLAHEFNTDNYLMLLVENELRVGTITGHIPLKDVASALSMDLILKKITLLHESLQRDFGIRKGKIAILGLNPHAGDSGVIGKEETEFIIPAIQKANENGMLVYGPYAADGFFGTGQWKKTDAVLSMYHDQGLIPFKTIAFERGVNFTAGLPVIRTSPDHGTAFDIAGKGLADPSSLRAAVYQAIDIFRTRKTNSVISANPLKQQAKRERDRFERG